jgi:transposase-like protein
MEWRFTPVERLQRFRPPFCPRRDCPDHLRTRPGYRCHIHGSYTSKHAAAVTRYRCLTCGKTFSRQAFSPTYYLKRPELLIPVAAGLVSGSAHRQIARLVDCAPSTVTRLSYRAGRHFLLVMGAALEALLGKPLEPIVLDHFETFEFSQDLPFGIATAVGQRSWFVYAIDPAPHRRSGRRTASQQRRVESRPARPRRGGYAGSTKRTINRLLRLDANGLQLVTDDHESYRRTIRRHPQRERIKHEVHPNPERGAKGSPRSKKAIRRDRAMFACDLLHGLARHSMAAHRRETIAFGRRLNALVLRIYGFAVWRNFVKRRSERRKTDTTPAMQLGLTDRRWTWRQLFAWRLFPDRQRLDAVERELYEQRWTTPVLPANTRHDLRLAY